MTLLITVHDAVPETESELVGEGLDSSNANAAPLDDVVPLACFARLPDGAVVGGAIGRTWGVCCELQQLWVEPARRRQGLGAELVKAFEARAAARGCSTYYLETFSFQAPSLYRSLGYEVALALEGFAPGIVKYTMVRRSAEPSP
ncbi:MAG: GNAT family N-acetyltransferase [Burkholderiales bacterium]|nr:GNAT family N-acetyltransferase [Burkholderiales bacterium]